MPAEGPSGDGLGVAREGWSRMERVMHTVLVSEHSEKNHKNETSIQLKIELNAQTPALCL